MAEAMFTHPHGYDLATPLETLKSTLKGVKKAHGVSEGPPDPAKRCARPPSLCLEADRICFRLLDDPFEERLDTNFALMVEEATEQVARRRVLDAKVASRRETPGQALSDGQYAQLYLSLEEKNSQVGISRRLMPERAE